MLSFLIVHGVVLSSEKSFGEWESRSEVHGLYKVEVMHHSVWRGKCSIFLFSRALTDGQSTYYYIEQIEQRKILSGNLYFPGACEFSNRKF